MFYTAFGTSDSTATDAWVFGLLQNSSVRSNLAVVNAGDASDVITYQYEIFDGESGRLAATKGPFTLDPLGWKQFNGVLDTTGVSNGYVHVVKLSGASRLIAYGAVNDGATANSGATNDGSFIAFSNR